MIFIKYIACICSYLLDFYFAFFKICYLKTQIYYNVITFQLY